MVSYLFQVVEESFYRGWGALLPASTSVHVLVVVVIVIVVVVVVIVVVVNVFVVVFVADSIVDMANESRFSHKTCSVIPQSTFSQCPFSALPNLIEPQTYLPSQFGNPCPQKVKFTSVKEWAHFQSSSHFNPIQNHPSIPPNSAKETIRVDDG